MAKKLTKAQAKIQDRVMVQIRVNCFNHKYKQALNNIYIEKENLNDTVEILLDAQKKIKNLKGK